MATTKKKTTKKQIKPKRPKRPKTKGQAVKVSISIPLDISKKMEEHIDGVTIKTRSHLTTIALVEWLKSRTN